LDKKDVFISHASEDKKDYVYPLVEAFKKRKISYWLDEIEINWGDRITRKINEGLSDSKFVIVLLTNNFLKKNWTKAELESVLNLENASGINIVLPILVAPNKEIFKSFPLMRDKLYIDWHIGAEAIANKLATKLKKKRSGKSHKPEVLTPISNPDVFASTKPSDKKNQWIVVTSEGTDYSEQQLITSKTFSGKLFQDKLMEGYWLTNLNYSSGNWVIAFSKGNSFSAQTCHIGKNFPRETIKRQYGKGFRITSVAYGLGKWIVVLSRGTELSNQLFNIRPTFPSAWINKNYKNGYRVTSLAYGAGKWAITLSKGSRVSGHRWWLPRTIPEKYISDNWSEGYRITSLVYGDGEWAIILSKGSNYSKQSLHLIDLPNEGEIKPKWAANNYVTNIEFGPT
jgi:hypothetical protein